MKKNEVWFCLSFNGELYCLGEHNSFESADEMAVDAGLNPIWTVNKDSAQQWLTVLKSNLKENNG